MCDIKVWMYVLSLAFQIAGAVLLIIRYLGKTKQRVIEDYYPGTGVASTDDNENAILDVSRVRDCVKNIYANRTAFFYIAIGYALSIFSDKGCACDIILLIAILGMTIVLIIGEMTIGNLLSKHLYKEDILIPYNKISQQIPRFATEKDIKAMFDDDNL